MLKKSTELIVMDRALDAANKCSLALEVLLKKAKAAGHPRLELIAQIQEINRQCHEEMEQYIAAYNKYYSVEAA